MKKDTKKNIISLIKFPFYLALGILGMIYASIILGAIMMTISWLYSG